MESMEAIRSIKKYLCTFPCWKREKKASWSFFHEFLWCFKGKERFLEILNLRSLVAQFFHDFSSYFWVKPHMVLKLRMLRIQCFKRIAIRSWNEGAMADWSKTCNYWIEFRLNCFWLFMINFFDLFLGSFCANWTSRVFLFSLTLSLVVGLFGNLDFIQVLVTKSAIGSLRPWKLFI